MDDDVFGYDLDGDGFSDTGDRGSIFGYDFDGDGDIDSDDDFIGLELERAYGRGCFIATAVYGDVDHPRVKTFRTFRDQVLRNSLPGRMFIALYYRLGPVGATLIEGHPRIINILRNLLNRLADPVQRRLAHPDR